MRVQIALRVCPGLTISYSSTATLQTPPYETLHAHTLTTVLDAQEATAYNKRTNSSEGSLKARELSSQVI